MGHLVLLPLEDIAPRLRHTKRRGKLEHFVRNILDAYQTPGDTLQADMVLLLMQGLGLQNPSLLALARRVERITLAHVGPGLHRFEVHFRDFAQPASPGGSLRHPLRVRGNRFAIHLRQPLQVSFRRRPAGGYRVEFQGAAIAWLLPVPMPLPPVVVHLNRMEVLGLVGWEL
jgi:hypothetical protein